jgi:hypothetical protein
LSDAANWDDFGNVGMICGGIDRKEDFGGRAGAEFFDKSVLIDFLDGLASTVIWNVVVFDLPSVAEEGKDWEHWK